MHQSYYRFISLLLVLMLVQGTHAQTGAVLQKTIALPAEKIQIQSLQVLEDGTPVLVMNGGVFIPSEKKWLVPPDPQAPIQDMAVLQDASGAYKLCVLQQTNDKLELKTLHRVENGVPKFRTAQAMPLGLFHISVMDSATTLIWGREKQGYSVYVTSLTANKKLLELETGINALQPLTTNSLLVATGGNLVVITPDGNMKPIGVLPATPISLVIDAQANIWVSTAQGIFMLPNGGKQFQGPLLNEGVGLLQVFKSQVWLADPVKKTLSCYQLK